MPNGADATLRKCQSAGGRGMRRARQRVKMHRLRRRLLTCSPRRRRLMFAAARQTTLEGADMGIRNVWRSFGTTVLALAFSLFVGAPAIGQTATGTIRGTISGQGGAPLADVQVIARNVESGVSRGTTSRADGFYVLPGLTPATYEMTVRRIGMAAQTRRVIVKIGATSIQDFTLEQAAQQVAGVQVVATPGIETRTSEVATNVTQAQMNNLPSSSRNFLELASLAPGITVSEDR